MFKRKRKIIAQLLSNNTGANRRQALLDGAPFRSSLLYTAVPQFAYPGTTATFTRSLPFVDATHVATKKWSNNDGYLVTGLAGEIDFPGARRVRNLLSATQAMGAAPWAAVVTGIATVTPTTGQSDPWGGTSAVKLVFSTSNTGDVSVWRQAVSVTSGNAHVSSSYIRADAPTTIYLRRGASAASATFAVTTEWQRFEGTVATAASSTCNFDFTPKSDFVTGTTGATIYVAGAQLEDVTAQTTQTAGEYVSVGALDYRSEQDPLYLSLPGTSGHLVTTPSAAANQIAGSKTIIFRGLQLSSVAPAGYLSLADWNLNAGTGGYSLYQDTGASGKLVYFHNVGAGTISVLSTATLASVGISTTQKCSLAITHNTTSGEVKFWYKRTDVATPAWTQLGATVASTAGATTGLTAAGALFGRADVPTLYNNNATVSRLELYSGVVTDLDAGTGGTLAQELYPHRDAVTPTGTITSSTTGEVWTINGASSVVRSAAYHGSFVDGVKCFPTALDGSPLTTMERYKPEAAATNVQIQSQDISTSWTLSGVLAFGAGSTVNATSAPDGTTTADLITPDTGATIHRIISTAGTTTNASPATISVYVKANGYTKIGILENQTTGFYASYDLQTGTVISTGTSTASIDALPNSWYRLTMTYTAGAGSRIDLFVLSPAYTSGAFSAATWTPNGTSGVYVWGAQVELGSSASSYIPTTTAAVTRNADILTYTGGDIPNLKTLMAGFRREVGVSNTGVVTVLTGGTDANTAASYLSSATASAFAGVVASVTQWSQVTSNAYTPGTASKMVWSQATNDIKMAKDGIAQTQDTVAIVPASIALQIGHQNGAYQLNGNVGGIYGWTRNLSQSELNAVSV